MAAAELLNVFEDVPVCAAGVLGSWLDQASSNPTDSRSQSLVLASHAFAQIGTILSPREEDRVDFVCRAATPARGSISVRIEANHI